MSGECETCGEHCLECRCDRVKLICKTTDMLSNALKGQDIEICMESLSLLLAHITNHYARDATHQRASDIFQAVSNSVLLNAHLVWKEAQTENLKTKPKKGDESIKV